MTQKRRVSGFGLIIIGNEILDGRRSDLLRRLDAEGIEHHEDNGGVT